VGLGSYIFGRQGSVMVCAGHYVPSCQSDKEPRFGRWPGRIAASALCALRLLVRCVRGATTAGVVRSLRCAV
jgi:hypothetical protein